MQVSFAECTPYDFNNIIEITQWSVSFHLLRDSRGNNHSNKAHGYYIMIIGSWDKS